MNPERKAQLKNARLKEVEGLKNNWPSVSSESRGVALKVLKTEIKSIQEGNGNGLRREIATKCAGLLATFSDSQQRKIFKKIKDE